MRVYNRSDGTVTYSLPELRTRRVFSPGEFKDLEPSEVEALFQTDGGKIMLEDYLLVDDKGWVDEHFPDAPIEYFWREDEIKKCLLEDSVELFSETLEYAPVGVIDLIKLFSWRMPLQDLNKIDVIRQYTGFDVLKAIEVMSDSIQRTSAPKKERLRKREG